MTSTPDAAPDADLGLPFRTWLALRRAEMALTQDELAARINTFGGDIVNGSVISHWESGSRRPNGVNLMAVCQALDVGIAQVQKLMSYKEPSTEVAT